MFVAWESGGRLKIQKAAGAIFIVVGTILLVGFGHQAVQAIRSSAWPTAEGVILASKVVQRVDRRNRRTDVPQITYRYSVGGIEHVGTRLFFGSQYSESWTAGAKWTGNTMEYIARYPPGAVVPVHYDPKDAATSVLDPGLKSAIVLPVVFSTVMIGGGVFIGLVGRLMAKKVRRTP